MATREVDPTTALLALVQEIVDRYGKPLPLADRVPGTCGWCGTRGHTPACLVDRLTTALFHVRAEQNTRSLDAVVQSEIFPRDSYERNPAGKSRPAAGGSGERGNRGMRTPGVSSTTDQA